ncbi:MAG: hypothetical protein P1V33_03455 [Pseudohongiella nitratireducens]|nr:hypothetical protein [Pseudohongiella nitratireducens]MDF1622511.1 hypothetical protein [Pseudohongiella nitratireducens]
MGLNELESQRHRLRRLRILQTLSQNRPEPVGDGLIAQVLRSDVDLSFTRSNIRNSLDYLSERGLVTITLRTEDRWVAKISADGVDFLDGFGERHHGVAHPDEF